MEKLINLIENYVEVDEITADSTFKNDLGMCSFEIMCLVMDIQDVYGITLKAADFVNYKTVGAMAAHLNSQK